MPLKVLFLTCFLWTLTACTPEPEPLRDVVIHHANGQQTILHVEIADDAGEREQGLMGRQSLLDHQGMLFLFPTETPLNFWMKNTPLFLDIIFIDRTGKIVTIHRKARPYDETLIPSRVPAQTVLEIEGGEAERLNIRLGDRLIAP